MYVEKDFFDRSMIGQILFTNSSTSATWPGIFTPRQTFRSSPCLLITNGQFQIQHILKQDPDIGEQFQVSIFSDTEMKQQIGTTMSVEIQDSSGPQGAINTGSAVFYITGVPAAGQTLTAVATSKDPDGDGTFSYQWEASTDSSSNWIP
ncbi:MAG: hypothetical protein EBU79_11015, partial [Betaproteobacteria bacterium]|nr:hypothetical protein [Betaproteobacteria bacterium]